MQTPGPHTPNFQIVLVVFSLNLVKSSPKLSGCHGTYRVIEIKLRSLALNTLYHKHYEVQLTSHGTQIRAIFSKVSCT